MREFPDSQYAGVARIKLGLLEPKVAKALPKPAQKTAPAPTRKPQPQDSVKEPAQPTPKRPASFLPWVEQVPPGTASAIDGVWRNEQLNKRFRIDKGRVITVDEWQYLFVKHVAADTVVTRDLQERAPGYFVGFDLPNQKKAEMRLQPDGPIWLKVATLIPYKAVMTPVKLDNQARFNRELARVKAAR